MFRRVKLQKHRPLRQTVDEPAPKKNKTASKPEAVKSGSGQDTDERDGNEEEESEEEEVMEPQVSQGKIAKKAAAKPRPEEAGGQSSIQAASSSVPTKGPARKAPAKG